MNDALRIRLPAVWVCLLAMALHVLSPLAACLAAPSIDAVIAGQICAMPGADGEGPGDGTPAGHRASAHCPICSLHTPAITGPVPSGFVVATPPLEAVPRLFLQAPRRLFAWVIAPSRAPPLSA